MTSDFTNNTKTTEKILSRMPRFNRMNDSTADIFEDDDHKTCRSAKKARKARNQPKKEVHDCLTMPDHVFHPEVVPLINTMAPAAARNQRDSYAGRRKLISS